LHLAGQDFQHILKRISLEIAVFLGFFRNKAISFTFPSIFGNFLQISFRFEFPYNFLQLVKISFKKEIFFKREALVSTYLPIFSSGTGCDLSGCAGTRPQCIMQHDIKVLSAYDKTMQCSRRVMCDIDATRRNGSMENVPRRK
jgi:hypothetical protein